MNKIPKRTWPSVLPRQTWPTFAPTWPPTISPYPTLGQTIQEEIKFTYVRFISATCIFIIIFILIFYFFFVKYCQKHSNGRAYFINTYDFHDQNHSVDNDSEDSSPPTKPFL